MLKNLLTLVKPTIISSVLIVLPGFVNQAIALGITGTETYSYPIEAAGVLNGQNSVLRPENAFTPFDPTLGTLTDVEIRIFGQLNYGGLAGANWVPDAFGTPIPQPYLIETEYRLDIDGLLGDYFSLDTPLIVGKQLQTPGGAGPQLIGDIALFDFTFDYDEAINLIFWGPENTSCTGCTTFVPPLGMSGQPDGFIDDGSLVEQLNFAHSLSFFTIGQVTPALSSLVVNSDITIQYTYEFTEFESNPIPLPAGFWLFGTALLGFSGLNRRRKAAQVG